MAWDDLETVKKGKIGERIVKEWLISQGYIVYDPANNGIHPFDFICAMMDKNIFIVDVKTKPARYKYPDQGIDLRHYNDYTEKLINHNIDIWLFFVDENAKQIYGNLLSELNKPHQVIHKGKILIYPYREQHTKIIYFPIDKMITIKDLSIFEIEEIKKHSSRCTYHQIYYDLQIGK